MGGLETHAEVVGRSGTKIDSRLWGEAVEQAETATATITIRTPVFLICLRRSWGTEGSIRAGR